MSLLEIYKANIQFVKNSGVEVIAESHFSWVDIREKLNHDNGIFLQGEQADDFIERANRLWEELEDITQEESLLACAYDYLDCLS